MKKYTRKTKRCPKGKILRKGYTATRGKTTYRVRPTCIKDRGEKGKGPKLLPKLKKGELSKYGYGLKHPRSVRRRALDKSMKEFDKNTLIRKLNVLSIYNKNTNPSYSRKAREDMNYIRKTKN